MAGIVGTHFGQVGHVGGQGKQFGINAFCGIISSAVGVESADASHVGGYRVVYGKERLVFAALRTVVGGFRGTFVPAAFVIRGGVVVCLAVVGAVISGLTQPLREEDVCRSIV